MSDNTTTRIPYPKKKPIPNLQQPIQANQEVRIYKKKKQKNKKIEINATYETPCDCGFGIFIIVFFIACVIFFSVMLAEIISNPKTDKKFLILVPIIFEIIAIVIAIRTSLYIIINISATSGIIIEKKKLFFCFNKQEVVKINDLKKVFVKIDYETYHKDGYNRFEIIFKLSNGTEVQGCSSIRDINGEARRAFQIFRNALPPRIVVSGNFAH